MMTAVTKELFRSQLATGETALLAGCDASALVLCLLPTVTDIKSKVKRESVSCPVEMVAW